MAVRMAGSVHLFVTSSTEDGRINAPLLYVNTASSSVSAFEIKCSLGGNRRSEVSTHFVPGDASYFPLAVRCYEQREYVDYAWKIRAAFVN